MNTLKETAKAPFVLLMKKLEGNDLHVDGMFMRCMENALRYYANKQKNEAAKQKCINLADMIQKTREQFQQKSMERLFKKG